MQSIYIGISIGLKNTHCNFASDDVAFSEGQLAPCQGVDENKGERKYDTGNGKVARLKRFEGLLKKASVIFHECGMFTIVWRNYCTHYYHYYYFIYFCNI